MLAVRLKGFVQRQTGWFLGSFLFLFLGCAVVPDLPAGANPCAEPARVRVLDFVDGDTCDVEFLDGGKAGEEERIRILAVDTPEVNHTNESDSECYALLAWNESVELLQGETAWLTYDEECKDRYDRSLAYLFRASDRFFLNQHLVEQGFARTLIISPNSTFQDDFEGLEAAAQQQGLGLWGDPCYGMTR